MDGIIVITYLISFILGIISLIVFALDKNAFKGKKMKLFAAVLTVINIFGITLWLQSMYFFLNPEIPIYLAPISSTETGLSYFDEKNVKKQLKDGDYLLAYQNSSINNNYSLTIVEMDSESKYREYKLNLTTLTYSKIIVEKEKAYFKLYPFYSDYIENKTIPQKTNPTIIYEENQTFYFLHVENGYGTIFQKPLNISYTANRIELLLKIQSAAQAAGYLERMDDV